MQFVVGETVVYPHHGAASITEVKKRVIKGEEKLGALSMRLGFCDQSSFTAQFRRHTGVTPSAFARGKKTLS